MKTTATKGNDRYLRQNYLKLPVNRMAKAIQRSETLVKCRLRQLGLVQPGEMIEQFKKIGQRKPGDIPPNKGKTQKQFMSQEGRRKCKATQFKKGNLPHNTKKDFEISIREDQRGAKYQHIRVKMGKWISLHRYKWEKKRGKIPKGMKLIFKNGDSMDCSLKNLELVTPGELMKRNSWHNYPAEIGKVIQLRGALTRQINKHTKRLKNEK